MKKTIEVDLWALEWKRLELFCERVGADGSLPVRDLPELVERLLMVVADGARRPGSWERDVLLRMFGEFVDDELIAPNAVQVMAHRKEAGWVGWVKAGDGRELFESQPCETALHALNAALECDAVALARACGQEVLVDRDCLET